ncbi:N-acetyltransferase family protein [Cupriavidus basilensis]
MNTEIEKIEENIRYADDVADVAACFGLMRQLRPHLDDVEEFISRWRRQQADGYRLMALWEGDRPVALAGFRLQDNLVHGVHFYVDDLVTDASARSGGYGARLMDRLKNEARALGCTKLVLDTPLTNVLGHRFYYRNGLLASALRFNIVLD